MKPWDHPKYQQIVHAKRDPLNPFVIDIEFANGDKESVSLSLLSKDFEPIMKLGNEQVEREYAVRMNSHELKIEWQGVTKVFPWDVIRFYTDHDYARHMVLIGEEQLRMQGDLLKSFRNDRGYTLAELSKRSTLSGSLIQKIEAGDTDITFSTLRKLLTALGYTLRDMAEEFQKMEKL